nr:hypothetical protein [Tanacetum cinerariifolium]
QNVFLVDIFGYYEQEQRAWVFSRSMLEMVKDKGLVWVEIVMKNELLPTKLDQVGGWWIVLSIEDKLNYLEQPIPPVPVAPAGQQEEGQSVSSYVLKIKGYIDNLERLGMRKTVNELHAMLKLHEQTLPKSNAPALNAIQADVCGPFKIMSRQGASYFITFTNDFSRYGYVYLLKPKHEVFETFKVFQKDVENQLRKTIKSLRYDRGGEYMSQEFLDHLKDHGIISYRTPPYTPQHNVWGCEALVKRDTLTKPDKLEPKAIKCIFVVYPKKTMGYSFYYLPENKVRVARNAEFLENSLIDQEASGSLEDLEIIQEEDTHRMCLYIDAEEHELGDLGEPANYKAALLDPESKKWLNAMNLFKKKTDMDGNVHIYKARLVTKGLTQTSGIDYEETFSRVAEIRAIRILIAIAAYYDYEIWQMDVKTAFLNGYLNEDQASRQWNKRFDDEIKKFGFTQNRDEPCGYIKASGSNVAFLILYVDDILLMGNSILMLQSVKTYLEKCFAMKDLGEAAYILGIKIYRDRSKRLIGQEKLKLSKSQGASTLAEMKHMQNVPYALAVGSIMNTKDMFLVYGGDLKRELRVSCYIDAGYLTDAVDLKS